AAAEVTAGRAGAAPTVPEGAGRLLADAGQLLGAAADAAASARRAADAAQAASEAVSVACEAVLLASRGERLAALEKLAAAQAQIDALRRGEVPARPVHPAPAGPALLPAADRAELRVRGLAAHPRAGWLLVAALGLGLLALVLALVK
ncbi:MAG: hypothetical protein HY908_16810, partial [Myxococcales bacterium]|nr:hypothetical protein [Myxococcales bacterium]